jgi:H/ACA ribonucleoprotein complex subunit 4
MKKKQMIQEGKLDKHGRLNENTPSEWKAGYKDFRFVAAFCAFCTVC